MDGLGIACLVVVLIVLAAGGGWGVVAYSKYQKKMEKEGRKIMDRQLLDLYERESEREVQRRQAQNLAMDDPRMLGEAIMARMTRQLEKKYGDNPLLIAGFIMRLGKLLDKRSRKKKAKTDDTDEPDAE